MNPTVELRDIVDRRTLVTDILGKPKALAKVGGKLVFAEDEQQKADAAIKARMALAASSDKAASSPAV